MKTKVSLENLGIENENISLVRVRLELTTLALSAPRSADWANGPVVGINR